MTKRSKLALVVLCIASMAMSGLTSVGAAVTRLPRPLVTTERERTTSTGPVVNVDNRAFNGETYAFTNGYYEITISGVKEGQYPSVYVDMVLAPFKKYYNGNFVFDLKGTGITANATTNVLIVYGASPVKLVSNSIYNFTCQCASLTRSLVFPSIIPAPGYTIGEMRIVHGPGTLIRNENVFQVVGGDSSTILFVTVNAIPGYQPPVDEPYRGNGTSGSGSTSGSRGGGSR